MELTWNLAIAIAINLFNSVSLLSVADTLILYYPYLNHCYPSVKINLRELEVLPNKYLIRSSINPDFETYLLFVQVHFGINFVGKNAGEMFRKKFHKFLFYNYGTFLVKSEFKKNLKLNLNGNVTYIQGYDPFVHTVKSFKATSSFALFTLLNGLQFCSNDVHNSLISLKKNISGEIEKFKTYLEEIKYTNPTLRIEFVVTAPSADDIFFAKTAEGLENLTYVSSEEENDTFLMDIVNIIFDKELIVKITPDVWEPHVKKHGLDIFNVIENFLESERVLPISDMFLSKIFYSEIMLKYFIFGNTKDMPYDAFKFCLNSETEQTATNNEGIIEFQNLDKLSENLNIFKTTHKASIGINYINYGIPQMKIYTSIILNYIGGVDRNTIVNYISDEDFVNFCNEKNLVVDEITINYVERILILMNMYGCMARKQCSLLQTNCFKRFDLWHFAFNKKSLFDAARIFRDAKNKRIKVEGKLEARVILTSLKHPRTLFGQFVLPSLFKIEELKDPLLSHLIFYHIENYIEVFPIALIYGSKNLLPYSNPQYTWTFVEQGVNKRTRTRATQTKKVAALKAVETKQIQTENVYISDTVREEIIENLNNIQNLLEVNPNTMVQSPAMTEREAVLNNDTQDMIIEPNIVNILENAVPDQGIKISKLPIKKMNKKFSEDLSHLKKKKSRKT